MNKSIPGNYFAKLLVFGLSVLISAPSIAATAEQSAAFNDAYGEYQEIVSGQGDQSRLGEVAERVYRLGETVFGPTHTNTAALSLNYARTLDGEEKVEALEVSLQLYEDSFGDDAPDLIDPYMELAEANAVMRNVAATRESYVNALQLVEEHPDAGSQLEGLIQMSIGVIDANSVVGFREREDHAQATVEILEAAQEIFEAQDDAQSRLYLAQTGYALGNFEIQNNNFDDAIEPLLAAVEIFTSFSAEDDITIQTHTALVIAYERSGRRDAATTHLIAIAEARPYDETSYAPTLEYTAYPRPVSYNGPLSRPPTTATGYTIVSFTVDKQGFVVDPEVVESEGSNLFPGAALRTIRDFRYPPRLVNGEAVDTPDVSHRFEHVPPIPADPRQGGRRR